MMRSIAAVCFLAAPLLHAADPHMTKEEREKVVGLLKRSQAEYLSYVEGLSDAQWTFKPGPDRWSVGETAEHIVLAEGLLFGSVEKAVSSPPNPDWEAQTKGKTEFTARGVLDSSQ